MASSLLEIASWRFFSNWSRPVEGLRLFWRIASSPLELSVEVSGSSHMPIDRRAHSHPLALESNFSPYIPPFLPFLYTALKSHEDAQLCTVAVGLIGDISRALGEQSAQYASSFMTVLLENLQSDILNRNVKITILSTFGDIALAIGPAFEPYLATTMNVLQQAGAVEPNPVCECSWRKDNID